MYINTLYKALRTLQGEILDYRERASRAIVSIAIAETAAP